MDLHIVLVDNSPPMKKEYEIQDRFIKPIIYSDIFLHKPILKKFAKWKVYLSFIDNIWGADLADKQLISKYDQIICYFICVTHIFSNYAWVIPIKDEKGISLRCIFKDQKFWRF